MQTEPQPQTYYLFTKNDEFDCQYFYSLYEDIQENNYYVDVNDMNNIFKVIHCDNEAKNIYKIIHIYL